MSEHVEQKIAQILLNIKAVALSPSSPFTWTSGLKSPIYCDNRLIISHPIERNIVAQALADLIIEKCPDVDVIAGTATAGIPHAALVAHLLQKPMIYVRSSAKEHGKKSAIEGELLPNSKVVMIEDLISTGKSVIHAANIVKEAGGDVQGCFAIFNYLLPNGKKSFEALDYPLYTLTNYEALIKVAVQSPELKAYQDTLEQWHQDPLAWSERMSEH
ncbi:MULTISPECIES: orotate phosphoribosyltransferase [unclassified Granulicatella]|uniref:orotate phosphoribosyltransferase n=1 Tax=unclassified Granulicatella TaxID=2630493 RepID=UPI0010737A80|nr:MULTISPECIES: orotate phosphoribosyltransferase [unclassified Granulicatella]MBF0780220.1 orotate phosphoribosyltransferase [Granulicatella sp. 19428wC4_WM01]TFU95654.1 orotate phosphoribosyltransferase [Granulicatella sp. WM01]